MPRRSLTAFVLGLFAAVLCSGCVFISGEINPFSRRPQPLEEQVVSGTGDAKILLLDISGVITSEERGDALGFRREESTVARIEAALDRAREDDELVGVVLRVNSPGGTVTGSDIIYEQLTRFRDETGLPIVVQMMDVATSGGYYAALAGDEIIACPTTVTGSIGVLFTSVSLEGLFDKVGVRNQTVASGSMKDIGSPLKNMSPAERAVLEALIGDLQERFVGLVRARRPQLTAQMQAEMVDGRVFSADQALAGGLVDDIGYLEQTIERVKQRAGVTEARVIRYRRPHEFADSLYAQSAAGAPQINLINLNLDMLPRTPSFLYLWAP